MRQLCEINKASARSPHCALWIMHWLRAFRHRQVQLCEIIETSNANYALWIDQRGPTVVQVVSGLFPLFDNNESSESGESIFRSIRSIRRCLIINE